MAEEEELLMAVLNSAPMVDGVRTEHLEGAAGKELARQFGGNGTRAELLHLRRTRDLLQAVIRGEGAAEHLAATLDKAVLLPDVTPEGIRWELEAPADRRLAARAALAWSHVVQELPGRLRACANTECNLFLIDHSRPGAAKWCSMATCGNRMKARAHAQRARRS